MRTLTVGRARVNIYTHAEVLQDACQDAWRARVWRYADGAITVYLAEHSWGTFTPYADGYVLSSARG